MAIALLEENVAGSGDFSGLVTIRGDFNFSLTGTWVGTITVQRSFDGGTTWRDVETFTSNAERVGLEPEGATYR